MRLVDPLAQLLLSAGMRRAATAPASCRAAMAPSRALFRGLALMLRPWRPPVLFSAALRPCAGFGDAVACCCAETAPGGGSCAFKTLRVRATALLELPRRAAALVQRQPFRRDRTALERVQAGLLFPRSSAWTAAGACLPCPVGHLRQARARPSVLARVWRSSTAHTPTCGDFLSRPQTSSAPWRPSRA